MQLFKGNYPKDMTSTAGAAYQGQSAGPVTRAAPVRPARREIKFEAVTTNQAFLQAHPFSQASQAPRPPTFFKTGEGKFDPTTQYSLNFQGRPASPQKRGVAMRSSIHTSGHAFVGQSEASSNYRKMPYSKAEPIRPAVSRDLNPDTRSFQSEARGQYVSAGPQERRIPSNTNYTTLQVQSQPFEGTTTASAHFVDWKAKPADICRPARTRDIEVDDRDFSSEANSRFIGHPQERTLMLRPPAAIRGTHKFQGTTTSGEHYPAHVGVRPATKILQKDATSIDPTENRDFMSVNKTSFPAHPRERTLSTKPVVEYKRTPDNRDWTSEATGTMRNHGFQQRSSFKPEPVRIPARAFYSETTAKQSYVNHPLAKTQSCRPKEVKREVVESRTFESEAASHFKRRT